MTAKLYTFPIRQRMQQLGHKAGECYSRVKDMEAARKDLSDQPPVKWSWNKHSEQWDMVDHFNNALAAIRSYNPFGDHYAQ